MKQHTTRVLQSGLTMQTMVYIFIIHQSPDHRSVKFLDVNKQIVNVNHHHYPQSPDHRSVNYYFNFDF